MEYVTLAGAAYLVAIGVIMGTPNIMSALFFKVLPVFLGIGIGFAALTDMGLL